MQGICGRAALAASLALLAALAGCGGPVDSNETPQSTQASLDARQPTDSLPASATMGAGAENQPAADGNVHTLGAAGGTSVLDPDVLISEQVKSALASSPDFGSSSKVDVHSEDGEVTLRGRAPDPNARERATDIARSIPNVKNVDNQLTLG